MPPVIPPQGDPKKHMKDLKSMVADLKITIDPSKPFDPADVVKKWKQIWPFLRQALVYARDAKITGPKWDARINDVIALGDKVADPQTLTDFLTAVKKYWKPVRTVLTLLKHVLPAKADEVIDKVIAIMDWLTGSVK